MKQLTANTYLLTDHTLCPKCGGKLSLPGMQLIIEEGYQLVYECPSCPASFAVMPITTFHFCELTTAQRLGQ